mgnify:CR=1 FL=1
MSYVGVTLQILEYYPQNFNYENFSFIFSSETRDFEKEILFSSKNSISHKIIIPRKNVKYSIKITRNNSLIGICDFIIPFQIFTKREGFFNKTCQMTMTDSIRRLIFGNISPNNIKININANLQYLEKGEKFIKSNDSNTVLKKEEKEKRATTPKKFEHKLNKNKYGNLTTILKLSKDDKSGMNKKLTEEYKKRSNSKPHMNNVSGNASLNLKIKNHQKGLKEQNKEKEKEIKKEKVVISNIKNDKKEEKEKEKNINKNFEDTSDIDEDLKNNNKTQDDKDILDFMNSFLKEHPLEKMDEIKEPYELMIYTKNIINELLNYQLNYYSSLINTININKKFNQLLFNYNEKYRLTLKKINKINEETKKNEIKQDLINNKQNIENNNLKQLLPLKQQELDLFKGICILNQNKKIEEEKYNEEQMKQIEEKKAKDANTQLLLIRILKNIYNKYGPLNNILNKENADENEIKNILNLSEKYNLPISEENEILEMENVECNNTPDEIDNQLEMYLKNYYKSKTLPKINFKKIGNNFYEYGNIKVNIFLENNVFKAKTNEGIINLEKFIEKNAEIEDAKVKNNKIKNSKKKK